VEPGVLSLSADRRSATFRPAPVLVMHGDDDESVPTTDTRQHAAAHGSAELSLFVGAGHRLRHDPRAVAVLFVWLDRVRAVDEHAGSRGSS
jgi:uncharacterized protein